MEEGPFFHRDENVDPKLPPLLVYFEQVAVKDERASEFGPPIYDTVYQAKVVAAGQKNSFPILEIQRVSGKTGETLVNKKNHWRFRDVFRQYVDRSAPAAIGTPLEQWPGTDVATIAMLKEANIYTVQQLADCPDVALDHIRGQGRKLRAEAKGWLEQAVTRGEDLEARRRIAELEEKLEKATRLLAEAQRADYMGAPLERRRRGRPPKDDGSDIVISGVSEGESLDI